MCRLLRIAKIRASKADSKNLRKPFLGLSITRPLPLVTPAVQHSLAPSPRSDAPHFGALEDAAGIDADLRDMSARSDP